jgi:hypothetical protein
MNRPVTRAVTLSAAAAVAGAVAIGPIIVSAAAAHSTASQPARNDALQHRVHPRHTLTTSLVLGLMGAAAATEQYSYYFSPLYNYGAGTTGTRELRIRPRAPSSVGQTS